MADQQGQSSPAGPTTTSRRAPAAPLSAPLAPCYDVAIVGLGPAGATLANLLALRGLSVLALDREGDIYRLPRAIHFDAECLRVFQTIGIAEQLVPDLVVAPGMRFVGADGSLLLDWQRPTEVGPHGWHASYRFHQPTLESALRERLAAHPRVDIRLRHELFAVDTDQDAIGDSPKDAGGIAREQTSARTPGHLTASATSATGGDVGLRLEDLASGRLLQTRARYVVGCDGARSTIRRFMGTELEDLESHERWLVVDVVLNGERPDLGDHSIQYCDPARPATYVRGPGRRRRWELMLLPGEDGAAMSRPETVWSLLSPWLRPDEATLERPAAYTFHSVVARGWRRGRLLIAGDAAHQTPPFMGQGMCAGIRDASNLAWKLADVISGRAADSLLDSYESERAPHVREFIETAVRLGALIQTTDPARARQRDIEMKDSPSVFSTPQPRLGPGVYDADEERRGADDAGRTGLPGEQPTLGNGERLDDRLGYRFGLLYDPAVVTPAARAVGAAAAPTTASTAVTAASPAVSWIAADSQASRAWLTRLDACAVLLRPDRYVAGLARNADEARALASRYDAASFTLAARASA